MKISPEKFYRLTIVADSNDADYVTQISKIKGSDFIEWVDPVIEKIRNCTERYNWYEMWDGNKTLHPKDMYNLTEEQYEWMCDYVPTIEGGTHSIVTGKISEWVEEENLFVKSYYYEKS